MVIRYAAFLSYDGLNFYGSQLQPNLRTVQGEFDRCLKNQFQVPIHSYFASRTDRGVHALCQVAHFDLPFEIEPEVIMIGLNKRLPVDIRILHIQNVSPRFHARHDVVSKTYQYTFLLENGNAFDNEIGVYLHDINIKKFKQALVLFKGKHNFASFTKFDETKDTIKVITKIKSKLKGNKFYVYITARSFLKYMIRIIMGSCYLYSIGKITLDEIKKGLVENTRQVFKYTAPAKGLMLSKIFYNEIKTK